MPGQEISGDGHVVSGGDIAITQIFPVQLTEEIENRFREIDHKIAKLFGNVAIATDAKREFFSEKLFSSLVNIGISARIGLKVALNIVPYIEEAVEKDGAEFSTAHIRRAVSHAISHLLELDISRSQRQDIAAKYARNYGNPKHICMIIFKDGRTQPITYKYLLDSFIPTMTKLLLVKSLTLNDFISRNNVEHMAREILTCVRRLGIYHIRYRTIVELAIDLATQLPHPWIIVAGNKDQTIRHDANRAVHHTAILQSESVSETDFWRSAYECFNHLCSAILGNFDCPIGGGTHAPSNTLRNVTRLASDGEHQNLALWDFCAIRDLEDPLTDRGCSMDMFHQKIKVLQTTIDRSRSDRMEFVISELRWLTVIVRDIAPTFGSTFDESEA